MVNSNSLSFIISFLLVSGILLYPAIWFFFELPAPKQTSPATISTSMVIANTLFWSIVVGLFATGLGWMIGIRISRLRSSVRTGCIFMLMATLAIPSYSVFYAWWQLWPAGSAIHTYVVENGMVPIATYTCLFLALVGWSWPIAALIAAMSHGQKQRLIELEQLDGTRFIGKVRSVCISEWKLLTATFILIAGLTATNTTCFDLSQVHTIGNEMRAVVAAGGSMLDVPVISIVSFMIAIISAIVFANMKYFETRSKSKIVYSATPVLIVWILFTSGPLLLSAMFSLKSEGIQLFEYYAGDLVTSGIIAFWVVLLNVILFLTSISLYGIQNKFKRFFVTIFELSWLLFAFLPSTIVVEMYQSAWLHVEWIYQSQGILIFAQVAKFGFIGILVGKWVSSGKNIQVLNQLDSLNSFSALIIGLLPRIKIGLSVVIGITLAMSLGEIALTAQLTVPSTNQPIAVALLNAMHYQRPQIVTVFLGLIIIVATFGAMMMFCMNRKFIPLFFLVIFVGCSGSVQQDPVESKVIGGVGKTDGYFVTPRALDARDDCVVVIDKTGRIQLFNKNLVFKTAWELPLNGMGFPTGVTIDENGLIWIPETHGHRLMVFNQVGNLLKSLGSYGTGDGEFLYPTDIAFGDDGIIFVSEYGGNDRISVFTNKGKLIRTFGHYGSDQLGFRRPQSIEMHPVTGHLFIADSSNHRIVEYTQEGEFIQQIGSAGRGQGELLYPYSIEFIEENLLLVTEFGNNRLQIFTDQGDYVRTIGMAGVEPGFFKMPWSSVKFHNEVLVADTGNNRLQVLPDIMQD